MPLRQRMKRLLFRLPWPVNPLFWRAFRELGQKDWP